MTQAVNGNADQLQYMRPLYRYPYTLLNGLRLPAMGQSRPNPRSRRVSKTLGGRSATVDYFPIHF
jgi:hypothetical protein